MKFLSTFFLAVTVTLVSAVTFSSGYHGPVVGPVEVITTNKQFNKFSHQIVDVDIKHNHDIRDIDLDLTAIGNNASFETTGTINTVQSNVLSSQIVDVDIKRNVLTRSNLNVDATAIGNNTSVVALEDVLLGNAQSNYYSSTSVDLDVSKNLVNTSKGLLNPELNLSAIGNNLSVEGTNVSLTNAQHNFASPVSVGVNISKNWGNIGNINATVTSVGNNVSVSPGL